MSDKPERTFITTCECSADPPRSPEECRLWNVEHNPGTRWALRACDCDCHWDDPEPIMPGDYRYYETPRKS